MEEPKRDQDIKFESKDIKINPHPEYFVNVNSRSNVSDFLKNLFSGRRRIYILSGLMVCLIVAATSLIYLLDIANKNSKVNRPDQPNLAKIEDYRDDPQKYIDESIKSSLTKVKDENGTKNYNEALSYLDERINSSSDETVKQTLRIAKSDLYYRNGDYQAAANLLDGVNPDELNNYSKLELYSRLATTYKHLDEKKSEFYRELVFKTAEAYEKEQYGE